MEMIEVPKEEYELLKLIHYYACRSHYPVYYREFLKVVDAWADMNPEFEKSIRGRGLMENMKWFQSEMTKIGPKVMEIRRAAKKIKLDKPVET